MKGNVYYYQPYGSHCGDPMPYYDARTGIFRIYYLHELRPNPAWTYHPIYAVETRDLQSYTALGEVMPTGSRYDNDAVPGTGSVVYCTQDNTYYFFYTGNRYKTGDDQCAQVVLCATSPDGVQWTKTDFYMDAVAGYYYRDDFRDPEVYAGDDGLYHMLVVTGKDGKHCLAEFTSPDCRNWTDRGVFMQAMWDRSFECPNLFKMGDWWYLVYSEQHKAIRRVQYFKGRTLDELKACTANDAGLWPDNHEGYLDSRGFYAGKTASDGTNRYIWGWCPTRRNYDNTAVNEDSGEPEWGGTLVAHRLVQHDDGSLTLGAPKGISDYFNTDVTLPGTWANLSAGQHRLYPVITQQTHLSFTVITGGADDKFGISVARDANTEVFYSLVVNPENGGLRKVNFEQEGGIGFIAGIDSYFFSSPQDRTYRVDIYIDNSVLVLYINDALCYTNRIYRMQQHGWSINCYSGSAQVRDIRQQIYSPDHTAVESGQTQDRSACRKYLQDGQIVIIKDGVRYTPLGHVLYYQP